MSNYPEQRIRHIQNNGYSIDFSSLWNNGFEIWKKVTLPVLLGTLAIMAIYFIAFALAFPYIMGMSYQEFWALIQHSPENINSITQSQSYVLRSNILSAVLVFLSGILGAGFIYLCRRADLGESITLSSIFDFFKPRYLQRLLLPISISIVTSLAVSLVGISGNFALMLGTYLLFAILQFFMVLSVSFIVFTDNSAIDSVKNSFIVVAKNPLAVFGFLLLGTIFVLLGFLACCFGIFLSMAYAYITQYLLYKQTVGFDDETPEENWTEAETTIS